MKVRIGPYKNNIKKRKIDVHIDDYDIWNMDHTLALIILPMLQKMKDCEHGSVSIDNEDVPERLRSTSSTKPKENEWDVDEFYFQRWYWVLDEMIWAFSAIVDPDFDDQFFTGEADITWEKLDDSEFYEVKLGPNNTQIFDKEEYKKANDRISNGTRLFGKYFRGLWT